jgi:hypothetical protein
MKFTVLEMVQELLSSLDSDEVNSIEDTVESMQVAVILRSVFYDLAVDLNFAEHETLFELNASGSSLKPTQMFVPENVSKLHWIKYDNREDGALKASMEDVNFVMFEDFLRMQKGLEDQPNVGEMSISLHGEEFPVLFHNDRHPQWWTSIDDRTIIFDAYDASIDTTLQKSKTMCSGIIYPEFLLEDSFIPDIDASAFSLLKNRAKVRAFAELKQAPNQEAASETRRQKIINQKRKRTLADLPPIYKAPRYGRNAPFLSGRVLTYKTRQGS